MLFALCAALMLLRGAAALAASSGRSSGRFVSSARTARTARAPRTTPTPAAPGQVVCTHSHPPSGAGTVTVTVHWDATPGASLYDVELAVNATMPPFASFTTPLASVSGLAVTVPAASDGGGGVSVQVWATVRAHAADAGMAQMIIGWSDFSTRVQCGKCTMLTVCWPCADHVLIMCWPCAGHLQYGKCTVAACNLCPPLACGAQWALLRISVLPNTDMTRHGVCIPPHQQCNGRARCRHDLGH